MYAIRIPFIKVASNIEEEQGDNNSRLIIDNNSMMQTDNNSMNHYEGGNTSIDGTTMDVDDHYIYDENNDEILNQIMVQPNINAISNTYEVREEGTEVICMDPNEMEEETTERRRSFQHVTGC